MNDAQSSKTWRISLQEFPLGRHSLTILQVVQDRYWRCMQACLKRQQILVFVLDVKTHIETYLQILISDVKTHIDTFLQILILDVNLTHIETYLQILISDVKTHVICLTFASAQSCLCFLLDLNGCVCCYWSTLSTLYAAVFESG